MNEIEHELINKYNKSSIGTHIFSAESELEVKETYTSISWFFLYFFGTSQNPIKVVFKCLKSQEYFCEMTNRSDIKNFMLYRPK